MKNLKFAYLLDFYKNLLSEKQFNALDLYYTHDLSLSEIADETGITRQGVLDLIKRGEQVLLDFESKIMLFEKFKLMEKTANRIKESAEKIGATEICALADELINSI